MAMLTLVSCAGDDAIDDDSSANSGASETVQITFTINMGGSTATTRAGTTWKDDDDSYPATPFENKIFENKLQVYVFSKDGNTFYGQLEDLSSVRHTDKENNIYDIVGKLEVAKVNIQNNKLACKIVVLANFDTSDTDIWQINDTKIENISSLDDIGKIIFKYEDYLRTGLKEQKMGIPMFGIKTYDGLSLVSGIQTDAGTIYMLRSMAKVRLVSQVSGYTVTGVTLKDFDRKGYIAPAAYATKDNTENIDYLTETFRCYGTHDKDTELSFITETEGESYYIYVPEVDAEAEGTNITVSYKDAVGTYTRTFAIGDYEEDIVRNHVYTFTLSNLTLQYQAMDWTDKEGSVTFE